MYDMKFILTRDYQSLLAIILQFVIIVKLLYAYISMHLREPGFKAEHTKYFTNSWNAAFHHNIRPMFSLESSSVVLLGIKNQRRKQNLKETNQSLSRQIYTVSDTHNKILNAIYFRFINLCSLQLFLH